MKLAYPIASPDCHGSLMALYGDFEKNLNIIRELGYQGVELLLRDADNPNILDLLEKIENHHLELAALATSPIPAEDKLSLADNNPQIRNEALKRAIGIARLAGKFKVPMLIGKFRGLIDTANPENNWDVLKKKLTELCSAAQGGGSIAVEIQQQGPVNTFTGTGETLALCNEIGMDNFSILLDTFHQERLDPTPCTAFTVFGSKVGFIHISDTDRLVPGTGTIKFSEIFAVLKSIKYDRYISMEVKQIPDSLTAARLCAAYLRSYMNPVLLNRNE
jgi:sugar phosphate isomerase/epimerase